MPIEELLILEYPRGQKASSRSRLPCKVEKKRVVMFVEEAQ